MFRGIMSFLRNKEKTLMFFADIIIVCISFLLSVCISYQTECSVAYEIIIKNGGFIWFAVALGITIIIFALLGLYNSLWSYAGIEEYAKIILACFLASVIEMVLFVVFIPELNFNFSIIDCMVLMTITILFRLYCRPLFITRDKKLGEETKKKNTMIIGAGRAGAMLIREFQTSSHSMNKVVCIIDSDKSKLGSILHGVKVVGGDDSIVEMAAKYNVEEIVFAIPSASNKTKKRLLAICKETNCNLKTLPALFQLANGVVKIETVRDVEIEDILGREPIKVDMSSIGKMIQGKCVLVTGGGGSIGSELCRQLTAYEPSNLIIVDIYENNAFNLQQELMANFSSLNLTVLIASVRDKKRIDQIFRDYRPQLVFHAAAHKHVPLMEDSPMEAVKNNIFGTYNVAMACDKYNVESMCLISTDKAVNPTNIMGATKRCCEMIVQMVNDMSRTRYVAVRFGNVLGSNGSVIPVFKEQIKRGGPITVTHKDIIRYFMTIPEAVSLILQATMYAEDGEIFVLDMGEPVKIDDLARNMIRLSGYEPDVDIEIKYTGLRPGEKLYEELLMAEEGLKKTANDLIFIGNDIKFNREEFKENLKMIEGTLDSEPDKIKLAMSKVVPTYKPFKSREANDAAL